MLIDKTFPANVRRVLWRFKIMNEAINLFNEADALLTDEERKLLGVMAERDRAKKESKGLR